MAIGKYSLMFVLMILIGIASETIGERCPSYSKHEAIREGLLTDRAICRARKLHMTADICLNGHLYNPFFLEYCSSGGCNLFGYNCEGHCLTGDDFVHREFDYALRCDISSEIRKMCDFYLKYEPTFVFYMPKLEKLCPNLKSECKSSIDKEWKY